MELFDALIFFSMVGLVASIALIFFRTQVSKALPLLETQARKRNGSIKSGAFIFYPQIKMQHNAGEISVYPVSGSKNSPPFTYFVCKLNVESRGSLRVGKEYKTHGFIKKLGLQDIELHIPDFDKHFLIQGDESFARAYLNENTRNALSTLVEWRPYLSINKKKLSLAIPKHLRSDNDYDLFIETGLSLLSQLQG